MRGAATTGPTTRSVDNRPDRASCGRRSRDRTSAGAAPRSSASRARSCRCQLRLDRPEHQPVGDLLDRRRSRDSARVRRGDGAGAADRAGRAAASSSPSSTPPTSSTVGTAIPRRRRRRRVGQPQVAADRPSSSSQTRTDDRGSGEQPLQHRSDPPPQRHPVDPEVGADHGLVEAVADVVGRPAAAARTDALPRRRQVARRPRRRPRARAVSTCARCTGVGLGHRGAHQCERTARRVVGRAGAAGAAGRAAAAAPTGPAASRACPPARSRHDSSTAAPITGTPADDASASTSRPRSAAATPRGSSARHRRAPARSTTSSTSATSRSLRARRLVTASASSSRSVVEAGAGARRAGQ